MSFDNLIEIIDGTILNSPTINRYNNIQSDPNKINLGDLFIAYNSDDIKLAITNGAYGIISESIDDILDHEIAWIRVSNLELAIKRLLRYKLIEKNCQIYYLSSIEIEIITSLCFDKEFIFLDKIDKKDIFHTINNLDHSSILSDNRELLDDIYPNYITINNSKNHIKLLKNRIFTTTFVYKENYYEDIRFPPIFIEQLSNILNFLDSLDIKYELQKIEVKNHFHPIFINSRFKIKNFGDSQHVIIIESDKKFLEKEFNYLKKEAKWAKTVILELDKLTNIDISKFNFILIEANYNEVIKILENHTATKDRLLFMEL